MSPEMYNMLLMFIPNFISRSYQRGKNVKRPFLTTLTPKLNIETGRRRRLLPNYVSGNGKDSEHYRGYQT